MKYIRTTKNIFEVVGETELVYRIIGASRDKNNVYSRTKKLNDVIKSADTIEELCDVFIKKSKDGDDFFQTGTDAFTVFDKKYEYYKKWFEYYDYYGAIWTDKGLIYVAKMNEKGDLELLWN